MQTQISNDDVKHKLCLSKVETGELSQALMGEPSDTEAEQAHQERPPAAASVPSPPPSSPPFRLASNLLVFPENLLLSSRQSEARDAIRLSVFVVASLSGSYLLQILRHGSPALHGGRKNEAILFLDPIKLS